MPCVTLLVTGVPRYAHLEDLSRALELLFNTDEIGAFKLRNLPNHPHTKNRQVALDFRSGFDAMAAQVKLDSYTYEYNGQMYTLFAKINNVKEYNRCNLFSPNSSLYEQSLGWSSLEMLSDATYRDIYTAHTTLDAQLELLRKKKMIVEAERELLREKRKLKREYGYMDGHDYEYEATSSKYHRPWSRARRSISRHRSRSRDGHVLERRSRSRSGHVEHSRTRYRSRSKRRSRSHDGRRSRSRDYDLRSLIRNKRARSKSYDIEGIPLRSSRDCRDRSVSRERFYRRSQSYERDHGHGRTSRERVYAGDSERRCGEDYCAFSREEERRDDRTNSRSYIERRSSERERDIGLRSKNSSNSWDRRQRNDVLPGSSRGYRYLRSPDRPSPLAIMPNPDRSETRAWSKDTNDDDSGLPSQSLINATIRNTTVNTAAAKNRQAIGISKEIAKDSTRIKDTAENRTLDNTRNQKEKQETYKLMSKFNSRIRKQELLEAKIEAVTQIVKAIVLLTLDEIISKDEIVIPQSYKTSLEKTLEELISERVEPLVRLRNDNDIIEAMRKYDLQYPKENDISLIRKMLGDISIKKESPEVPCTNPANVLDKKSSDAPHQCTDEQNCNVHENTSALDRDNNSNQILKPCKQEHIPEAKEKIREINKDEPIIIDIASPEKPVTERPKFAVVIKRLLKDMKKAIVMINISQHILSDLRHVLRHMLWELTKGQAYMTNKDINDKFRALYPIDKDEQFIKDVMRDIKDGKYPGLTPRTDDFEEDVIILEKKYDVVTIEDSDDETKSKPDISGEYESKSPTQKKPDLINSSLAVTGYNLGTNNTAPETCELDKDKPTMESSERSCSKNVTVGSNQIETDNHGTNYPAPSNHNMLTSESIQSSSTVNKSVPYTSKLVQSNPNASEPQAVDFDLTALSSVPISKLVNPNPDTSELRVVSPVPTPVNSKLVTSNPDISAHLSTNLVTSAAPAAPAQPAVHLPANLRPIHINHVNSVTSNIRPMNLGPNVRPTNSRWDLVTRHSRTNAVELSNDTQDPQPSNHDETELKKNPRISRWDMVNSSGNATEFKAKLGLPGLVTPGLYDLEQDKLDPLNVAVYPEPTNRSTEHGTVNSKFLTACLRPMEFRPSLVNPGPAIGTAKTVTETTRKANTGIIEGIDEHNDANAEAEDTNNSNRLHENIAFSSSFNELTTIKEMTTEETIENIKKETNKFENSESELTALSLNPVLEQTSPETSLMTNTHAKHRGNKPMEDNNSNCLKVTAITIITSLNELAEIAKKTNDMPEMDGPIDDIKEEISFESDIELDNSSLNLEHLMENTDKQEDPIPSKERNDDNNNHSLKVTAITIMTSLNELTAIADKSNNGSRLELPIEDVKEEIPFENSQEINCVSILASSDESHDVKNYGNGNAEYTRRNILGANEDMGDSNDQEVGCVLQGNHPESTSSENGTPSQDKTVSDEEDETIESILKYVQSLC